METFVFLFTTQLLYTLSHPLLHCNHQKFIDIEQFHRHLTERFQIHLSKIGAMLMPRQFSLFQAEIFVLKFSYKEISSYSLTAPLFSAACLTIL